MDQLIHYFRTGAEYLLVPFDAMPSWLSLAALGLLTGIAMLWVVGKTTPQRRLERARDRMAGSVYEVRLYLSSPLRVFRAQGRLLSSGLVYTACMLPALLVLALPLSLFYMHLEVRHGLAPLATGEPFVVRLDLSAGAAGDTITARTSPGASVTAPPVFSRRENRVYLRVEIDDARAHTLTIRTDDVVVTKKLSALATPDGVRPERGAGIGAAAVLGSEAPLSGPIRRITVPHPHKEFRVAGFEMPWWGYWLGIAALVAFALRRRFGVVL